MEPPCCSYPRALYEAPYQLARSPLRGSPRSPLRGSGARGFAARTVAASRLRRSRLRRSYGRRFAAHTIAASRLRAIRSAGFATHAATRLSRSPLRGSWPSGRQDSPPAPLRGLPRLKDAALRWLAGLLASRPVHRKSTGRAAAPQRSPPLAAVRWLPARAYRGRNHAVSSLSSVMHRAKGLAGPLAPLRRLRTLRPAPPPPALRDGRRAAARCSLAARLGARRGSRVPRLAGCRGAARGYRSARTLPALACARWLLGCSLWLRPARDHQTGAALRPLGAASASRSARRLGRPSAAARRFAPRSAPPCNPTRF